MEKISKHDLRLGNMFEQGIVFKISGRAGAKVHLHGKGKWYKGFRSEVAVEDLKPIVLTPQILTEWCGFIHKGDGNYEIKINGFHLMWNGEFFYNDWTAIRFDHLHHLQNGYKILMDAELEIKE